MNERKEETHKMAAVRYPVEPLTRFTSDLLAAAGLEDHKAETVARLLVTTDMLGRPTHGVALSPLYVEQLEKGLMTPRGEPECLRDSGAVLVWDGNYLPGLWLVHQAVGIAIERVATHGVVTFAMRRSHHIACLATLAKLVTDRGCVAILATSDPAFGFVAPYGGREPLLTPNPFAIGYPGTRTPVLIDICASITTVSMTRQKAASGETFEQPWLLDAAGRPTSDPRVLEQTDPRGSLLLLGGLEYGHKGFGLALMVEALTQGLSGLGRKDTREALGRECLSAGSRSGRLRRARGLSGTDGFSHGELPGQRTAARGRAGAHAGRAGGAELGGSSGERSGSRRAYAAAAQRYGRAVRARHAAGTLSDHAFGQTLSADGRAASPGR